jgi:NAD-dependent DNA ligase
MTMPSKSAEEYCIECTHGLFEPDTEINQRLHAKGLTEEQVQEVYDLAAERLMPMIVELAGDFQAEREVEKLVAHFGGKEQWQEISRQLLAYGQQHLPKDVLQNLSSSFEGVLALYSMMKGETPNYAKAGGEMRDKANGSNDMNELKSMMRDPKYWRDKDPAFVAKVTDGFKRIYKD